MMPTVDGKPARRGRPRSAETEHVILESAYRIMASQGLAAASIDAIARDCGVSKMTIYKWWPSREALLIDAFLRQAASMLPLPETGDPLARMRKHAAAYVKALNGDFGKVQLAVIAECIAGTGSAKIFSERYLAIRRDVAIQIIKAGQRDDSIVASESAGDLYDRIYGTLFYQYVFGFRALTKGYAEQLVMTVLARK
ncbi:TetR/AcrR family transcriptional regulator [Tardiphaga sp. vice352]|uniref:TetR/AcrR family transcriptional regulator n=2 Tax=Tardiphaga TaxID=1395974 RepID=UPI001163FA4E|nr:MULTISPECIES: TetR/AcrR family transcriptional regulator [unclassified Tardiphaga]MBC7584520.1 TetR/AcrR family transcriptional regulator [Tardiphaga sp.]QDM19396.1 TetR/AcrR family transcriptional regulator [Tardiphaga sp. vice278]QDM24379.1 TetR/AcrR family transcriptional regulator [Tardiphaga sp. vice154]QDM29582.1 TetR/AcrR family transcriptional regulator [Tardiphaga sp. vice304]QDM34687.1 TetR/AcrR family transcriptional regulator [Tardiphaga sp. vice352]